MNYGSVARETSEEMEEISRAWNGPLADDNERGCWVGEYPYKGSEITEHKPQTDSRGPYGTYVESPSSSGSA